MQIIWILIWSQLSPGELHATHQHLEGLKNCSKCHKVGSKSFSDQCLACHQLLQKRIASNQGFHGRLKERSCQTCHKEHFGRDFTLIHWADDMQAFDHRKTGFLLKGKHKSLACRDCHLRKNLTQAKTLKQAGKDLDRTFLGLKTDCSSCHRDPHRGKLNQDCTQCHDSSSWRPATGFNHAKAAFQLTGAHLKVKCEACHEDFQPKTTTVGTKMNILSKTLKHDQCSNCHKDQHSGQLGQDCTSCHTPDAWKPAGKFDHKHARFQLTGLHKKVHCDQCHKPTGSDHRYRNLKFNSCAACHKDVHNSQLGPKCSTCHSTQGWGHLKSSNFDHSITRFSLKGRHAQVSCDKCHTGPGGRKANLQFEACSDCHKDVHRGDFQTFDTKRCESCHDEQGFKRARFGIEKHSKTQFPLTDAHLAVACRDCHSPSNKTKRKFSRPHNSCLDCHTSPHHNQGQFHQTKRCEDCHSQRGWSEIAFNHTPTGFELQGAHRKQACSACHERPLDSWSIRIRARTLQLGPQAEQQCQTCHEDPHRKQLGPRCSACHVPDHWTPDLFDHSKSRFSLDGAHANLHCNDCHKKQNNIRIYKPINPSCQTCHGTNGSTQ